MSGCFFLKHGVDLIPVDGRKKAGQGRPGCQHFVTTYVQEESAGARRWN